MRSLPANTDCGDDCKQSWNSVGSTRGARLERWVCTAHTCKKGTTSEPASRRTPRRARPNWSPKQGNSRGGGAEYSRLSTWVPDSLLHAALKARLRALRPSCTDMRSARGCGALCEILPLVLHADSADEEARKERWSIEARQRLNTPRRDASQPYSSPPQLGPSRL